jgi:hypothetical protein
MQDLWEVIFREGDEFQAFAIFYSQTTRQEHLKLQIWRDGIVHNGFKKEGIKSTHRERKRAKPLAAPLLTLQISIPSKNSGQTIVILLEKAC